MSRTLSVSGSGIATMPGSSRRCGSRTPPLLDGVERGLDLLVGEDQLERRANDPAAIDDEDERLAEKSPLLRDVGGGEVRRVAGEHRLELPILERELVRLDVDELHGRVLRDPRLQAVECRAALRGLAEP